MNTRKLIYGAIVTLFLAGASCTTDSGEDGIYEVGVDKRKVTKGTDAVDKRKVTKGTDAVDRRKVTKGTDGRN